MNVDFAKYPDGLVPAIIQDAGSGSVLMLGFMNEEALAMTQASGRVTFFSRSKGRLWTKGESSGNWLDVISIGVDCDSDTMLVRAIPRGPVCHTGAKTCFGDQEPNADGLSFLSTLSATIRNRREAATENAYVGKLFSSGLNSIAQKVGEEAVEVVIAAKDDDQATFNEEAADLLFHLMVLVEAKNSTLDEVVAVLKSRHFGARG